jgi:hypothetical protein
MKPQLTGAKLASAPASGSPPTPKPPFIPPLVKQRSYVPKTGAGIWLARAAMVIVVAGAVGLIYWSIIVRLQPVNRQFIEVTMELSRLADEVEQMKIKLRAADVENVKARYESARQYLFGPDADLEDWQIELKSQGQLMTYHAGVRFGERQPYPNAGQKLAFVPASIELRPVDAVGMTNSPYKRLLELMQALSRSPKRFDMVELVAEGNSNSVREARAAIQLLAENSNQP